MANNAKTKTAPKSAKNAKATKATAKTMSYANHVNSDGKFRFVLLDVAGNPCDYVRTNSEHVAIFAQSLMERVNKKQGLSLINEGEPAKLIVSIVGEVSTSENKKSNYPTFSGELNDGTKFAHKNQCQVCQLANLRTNGGTTHTTESAKLKSHALLVPRKELCDNNDYMYAVEQANLAIVLANSFVIEEEQRIAAQRAETKKSKEQLRSELDDTTAKLAKAMAELEKLGIKL